MDIVGRNKISRAVVYSLAFIPVLFWMIEDPVGPRFATFQSSMHSLGQLTALVGAALFAVVLVLNTRLSFIDRAFGGLDRAYVEHHRAGAFAFILLLFHPVFLALQFLPSTANAARFLLSTNPVILFGIAALLLMEVLLICTFFVKMMYPRWRGLHQYLGAAFLLATFHMIGIQSDISRNGMLRTYMLTLIALGLLAFLYRTVLGRLLVPRHPYTVKNVIPMPSDAVELTLEPSSTALQMAYPGQFVFLSFKNSPMGIEAHPFTASSAPQERELRLTIKASGDWTTKLAQKLTVGTAARIEGPFGTFSYGNMPSKKQIWIAGGIGITPFLSMARALQDPSYEIDLWYSVKKEDELVSREEFKSLAQRLPSFRFHPFVTETEGFLTAEKILGDRSDINELCVMLCGPEPMKNALCDQFHKRGVDAKMIFFEQFNLAV